MKKKLLLCALLLILAAIAAMGTTAYVTKEARTNNVITTGTISLDLRQETEKGVEYPINTDKKIRPGQTVSLIPYVENSGTSDLYTRVRISVTMTPKDEETKLSSDVVSFNIDTDKWLDGGDGWLYWHAPVKPGAENCVAPFTEITFSGDGMEKDYENCQVSVSIMAQAVQVKNNEFDPENSETVLNVVGWAAEGGGAS